jgi:uncharacterized protein (TIGR00725 family)
MLLEATEAHAAEEYRGRIYYFCSSKCHNRFKEQPETFSGSMPGMRLTVGVMGSASPDSPRDTEIKAYRLGEVIAAKDLTLITGACPGLPYRCARGVKDGEGFSVGISPGLSLDEHVHKYLSPSDAYDVIIYTGSGLMGREVTNIRSSDFVIIIGGRSGTLGEFAIAYDEGKLIGVMKDTGGITTELEELVASFQKDTGATLVYESDPDKLIEVLLREYTSRKFKRPSCFCGEIVESAG